MLDPAKYDPQSSFYKTKPKEDLYLASPSSGDQFSTDVKSVDKDNNTVAIIEGLFILNIRHKSSYEKLMKKAVNKTCKFFMHSVRYISSKDRVVLHGIRSGLRPFQALEIFLMLQIEVDTSSGGILVDELGYGKVRYLIFGEFIVNIIRHFNV